MSKCPKTFFFFTRAFNLTTSMNETNSSIIIQPHNILQPGNEQELTRHNTKNPVSTSLESSESPSFAGLPVRSTCQLHKQYQNIVLWHAYFFFCPCAAVFALLWMMLCFVSFQSAGGPPHHVFHCFQKWKVSSAQCCYSGEQLVTYSYITPLSQYPFLLFELQQFSSMLILKCVCQ